MSKRILLAAMTSHVRLITEALYLWKRWDDVIFDEVHVVTDTTGRDAIYEVLLEPLAARSPVNRLCRRLGIKPAQELFSRRAVHLLDQVGWANKRSDIGRAVDVALDVIRALSCSGENHLDVVVEEGDTYRALAFAFSLQVAGGPADRLFVIREHPLLTTAIRKRIVLDFWHPTRAVRVGSRVIAEDDLLQRVEVPLLLTGQLGRDWASPYLELVRRRRHQLTLRREPATLTVNLAERRVQIDGVTAQLTPMQFFWYAYLAMTAPQKLIARDLREAPSQTGTNCATVAHQLSALHSRIFPNQHNKRPIVLRGAGADPASGLRPIVAKINAALRAALGPGAAPYLISTSRGTGGYALSLDPAKIVVGTGGGCAASRPDSKAGEGGVESLPEGHRDQGIKLRLQ